MDVSIIIPWIPKLAAALLVILGILIILEIRAMLKRKNASATTIPEEPVQVTKVRFPETVVRTETIQTASGPVPTKYKKLLISIPIVVVALFAFVHFLSGRTTTNPEVLPSPTPPQIQAEIVIYRFGEVGDLELLNYDELKKLEPNTEIIIAVTADPNVQQATFTINGEDIMADIRERTPNGEIFVDYVLRPGIVDYFISVRLE